MKLSRNLCLLTMLFAMVMIFMLPNKAQAATTGNALTSPEAGWQRYDDTDANIVYSGVWHIGAAVGNYKDALHYDDDTSKYQFKFYGTKLRLIVGRNNISSTSSTAISVKIDGQIYHYSNYSKTIDPQIIGFEKLGMEKTYHTVEVQNQADNYSFNFDALDIDDTGYLIPITKPTNLTAAPDNTNTNIVLNWDAVEGAQNYIIKRGTTAGGPYSEIQTIPASSISYSDGTVQPGNKYYYVVSAIVSGKEGPNSNETSSIININAATGLTATSYNKQIILSWNAVNRATEYKIYRSTTPGDPNSTPVTGSAIITTSFTDSEVVTGTTYYYTVSAIINGVEGPKSSPEVIGMPKAPSIITGDRAILVISFNNKKEKEYDLSADEIDKFVDWYDKKSDGTGKAYFALPKNGYVKPFNNRKEYIKFDTIESFEIKDYNDK